MADDERDGTEDERVGSDVGHDSADAGPQCPFCDSTDVKLESAFGSEVSKSQYYCNGCHTVFERIKFDGALPDTGRE